VSKLYRDLDAPPSAGCIIAASIVILMTSGLIGAAVHAMLLATGEGIGPRLLVWGSLAVVAIYLLRAIARYRRTARRRPSVDLAAEVEQLTPHRGRGRPEPPPPRSTDDGSATSSPSSPRRRPPGPAPPSAPPAE